MTWERLSVRNGDEDPDVPFELIPNHLAAPIMELLKARFTFKTSTRGSSLRASSIARIAVKCRITINDATHGSNTFSELRKACYEDRRKYLNVLDASLVDASDSWRATVRKMLAEGGSAWTVSDAGDALERVIDPVAKTAAREAMTPVDRASVELREAWDSAYGVAPNPSDVWDHAIKALEELLIPIVTPKQTAATLGHVVSHLATQGSLWRFAIPGADKTYSVEPLVHVLRLIWPNADRHGGGAGHTTDIAEAQAVLHAAITVAQWARAGALVKV